MSRAGGWYGKFAFSKNRKEESDEKLRQRYETGLTDNEQLDLRIWLRLLTCTHLIERQVRKNLRENFATTLPRFDVLAQIDRAPNGMSMRELSSRLMVTSGNITPLVDRLAHEKLIRRDSSAEDRRVQYLSLTAKGKRVLNKMIPAHSSWVNALMTNMDKGDALNLHKLLGDLKGSILKAEIK